jgi:hypothetical protein
MEQQSPIKTQFSFDEAAERFLGYPENIIQEPYSSENHKNIGDTMYEPEEEEFWEYDNRQKEDSMTREDDSLFKQLFGNTMDGEQSPKYIFSPMEDFAEDLLQRSSMGKDTTTRNKRGYPKYEKETETTKQISVSEEVLNYFSNQICELQEINDRLHQRMRGLTNQLQEMDREIQLLENVPDEKDLAISVWRVQLIYSYHLFISIPGDLFLR